MLVCEMDDMLPHIKRPLDLITSREAVRYGFLQQAMTKIDKAAPYVGDAYMLDRLLKSSENIYDLLLTEDAFLQKALIAMAGFSDKARGHLGEAELQSVLAEVLKRIHREAGDEWRSEIVYRYLLTRGDTLGGSMRNWAGAQGNVQLVESVREMLRAQRIEYRETANRSGKITGIQWAGRLLVFDRKPQFVDRLIAPEQDIFSTVAGESQPEEKGKNNNIDMILLDIRHYRSGQQIRLDRPEEIIACGEIKGGIDPAGADEHFKTASTAFKRIRSRYSGFGLPCPSLFFVGAAIERAMAFEIFQQLERGELTYAANLTVPEQVADLALWLVLL
ncbi:MAG: hypothetical protein IT210_13355 [Armatimonadetes bacterium]|nr:hypothetical protein [Armatimonadota bacterium]